MASKAERTAVNVAGLVQGIVLVTFPAASTILTSKSQYGLSSTQYGIMFLPQVVTAIATSLLGSALARRITTKRVYLIGLTFSAVSMGLLLGSTLVKTDQSAAWPPARFWVYAAFALLYGICETMNGNWSQLDMTSHLGASATQASVALAVFWAMVTVGRVLFAAIGRWLPERVTYRVLPLALVAAFALLGVLPPHDAGAGIALFGLAGLGCSALLPLTISFGVKDLTAISAAMAGGVIAFYQLGYGMAAFGVGPLQKAGVSLPTIFGGTAVVAAALAILSFAVVDRPARGRPAPASAGRDAGDD